MDRNVFESHWTKIKGLIAAKWTKLTEEDLSQIGGNYEQFLSKLQQRYGLSREQVEEEVRRWKPDFGALGDAKSPLAKWLPWLIAAIALIWLLNNWSGREEANKQTPVPQPKVESQGSMSVSKPDMSTTDVTILQALREAFKERNLLADLSNIRVEINKGEVTLTGSVPTAKEKELIARIVERLPAVVKVNNQIQVEAQSTIEK